MNCWTIQSCILFSNLLNIASIASSSTGGQCAQAYTGSTYVESLSCQDGDGDDVGEFYFGLPIPGFELRVCDVVMLMFGLEFEFEFDNDIPIRGRPLELPQPPLKLAVNSPAPGPAQCQ